MGEHRAPRPVASNRGRIVFGVLAMLSSLVLLLGAQGTFAFWSDSATVTGGQISSGKLDLTVDGAQGKPNAYAEADLALTSMVPGESVAEATVIANVGDADFTWVPTLTTGGDLGPALAVRMVLGGTPSGNDTTYPRTETCTGGTVLTSAQTTTRLNKGGATQNLCIEVSLPTTTDDAYQSKTTGSVSVSLAARQVVP